MKRTGIKFLSDLDAGGTDLTVNHYYVFGNDQVLQYYITRIIEYINKWDLKYFIVDSAGMWLDIDWQYNNGFEHKNEVPVYCLGNKVKKLVCCKYRGIILGCKDSTINLDTLKKETIIVCDKIEDAAKKGTGFIHGFGKGFGYNFTEHEADTVLFNYGSQWWILWNMLQMYSLGNGLIQGTEFKSLSYGNLFDMFNKICRGKVWDLISSEYELDGIGLVAFLETCFMKLTALYKRKNIQDYLLSEYLELGIWTIKKYRYLIEGMTDVYIRNVYNILRWYKERMYNQLYDTKLLSKLMLVELGYASSR